ncbi:protein ABHD14A [Ambystoma mexicanum]|uniref:protein ABHD14A n=1 Tax=Ambystoma mexicanum TaxID=8296 RepID=UPI0037E91EF8
MPDRMSLAMIRSRLAFLGLGLLVSFLLYLLLPAIQQESSSFSGELNPPRLSVAEAHVEARAGPPQSNVSLRTGKTAGDSPTFYIEAVPMNKAAGPKADRIDVLLLHGQSFTSKTWQDLGTLSLLAENGYRAVALDLPGYGMSLESKAKASDQGRVDYILRIIETLGLKEPILVSPSMSGMFSLPLVLQHGEHLKGFVPIAPVGTKGYSAEQYQRVQTPTLIVYGERDTNLGTQSLENLRQIPKHTIAMLANAKHACYLDQPRHFHQALLGFLNSLK